MSLYNGKSFPDYIFKDENLNILFFDFYDCFSVGFNNAFAEYLAKMQITEIAFNNIEPGLLPFNQTFAIKDFPGNYVKALTGLTYLDYSNSEGSIYMYTEIAEIFPPSTFY